MTQQTRIRNQINIALQTAFTSTLELWIRPTSLVILSVVLKCIKRLVLTIFSVIGILSLALDSQRFSDSGKKVLDIARLIPTIYPIIFAAVAGRFYKNLARWQLEHPQGVRVGNLEQVFGSQSLAASFERLLFVRAHIPLGIIIFALWSLSPLGGQAGSRVLYFGENSIETAGSVYYLHPSYQVSRTRSPTWIPQFQGNIDSLYSASLISSPAQKKLAHDLWDLPRIPQWRTARQPEHGKWYKINNDTIEYVSLLGIIVQGLTLGHNLADLSSWENEKVAPSIQYLSRGAPESIGGRFSCDVEAIVLETEMTCKPSPNTPGCVASRRRIDNPEAENHLLDGIFGQSLLLRDRLLNWRDAAGINFLNRASPTDAYLSSEDMPYGMQSRVNWTRINSTRGIDAKAISRRMTTSFNTFCRPYKRLVLSLPEKLEGASTSDPNLPPFLNSTDATATITNKVYLANRAWVTVLIITTLILELLAVLGFALRFMIRGPDILGFASSLTRENPYTPLAAGGTGLDGPDRARELIDMRVQLVDVRPKDEIGYIAIRQVRDIAHGDSNEGSSESDVAEINVTWQPLPKGRLFV
ncbi:unnamed protein product [Clonostachys chloroleuca]|uniref:Uncharacterized protein n=1 Tax=Clonostachys chloroleuca TaxID=1926264 RepID=A0AA35Q1D1_9HYPO|nr:unnamed protein product [Clonostachys chloroleuca]